jgi:hypothetical protein
VVSPRLIYLKVPINYSNLAGMFHSSHMLCTASANPKHLLLIFVVRIEDENLNVAMEVENMFILNQEIWFICFI